MRDEDKISPAAARLLQAARHADDPTPSDRARIGRSLQKAMIVGVVSAASSAASSAATAAAPSLLGKVIFVAATAGLLGTGGVWLSQRSAKIEPTALVRQDAQPSVTPSVPFSPPQEEQVRVVPNQEQLLAETKLLQAAQKALHRGKHRRAMTLLHQHMQRFPQGVLQPERDAARVFALCEAGDVKQAQQAAQKFAATHPTSPLLAKVKATCVRSL